MVNFCLVLNQMDCHTIEYFGYKGWYSGYLVKFEDVEAYFEAVEANFEAVEALGTVAEKKSPPRLQTVAEKKSPPRLLSSGMTASGEIVTALLLLRLKTHSAFKIDFDSVPNPGTQRSEAIFGKRSPKSKQPLEKTRRQCCPWRARPRQGSRPRWGTLVELRILVPLRW